MGWYNGFDHYTVTKDLDLASWDWYVGSGYHDYLQSGAAHDLARGLNGVTFGSWKPNPGTSIGPAE